MKQYITKKQLNELSEKGKKRYFSFCQSHGYIKKTGAVKEKDLLLLSIGQMVEFLGDELSSIDCMVGSNTYIVWDRDSNAFQQLELVDALWKLTKKKLEK